MPRTRWSTADKWAFGVLLAAVLVGLNLWVHPWYDPINDAIVYIGTAQSLAAGEGYTYHEFPSAYARRDCP
jgi:lipopolysaccharide export LptBFGC system permease protein LptF